MNKAAIGDSVPGLLRFFACQNMRIFSNRRKSDILTMSLPSLTAVRFKISSQRCFYPSCSTHILSLDGLRLQLPQLSPDRGSHAPPDRRLRRTGIFQSGKWYCKQNVMLGINKNKSFRKCNCQYLKGIIYLWKTISRIQTLSKKKALMKL